MSSEDKNTRTRILETTWGLLEADPGRSLSMSAIAKATGISRQALYLHFVSRAELLSATTRYVDEVNGLDEKLEAVLAADTGEETLLRFIRVWGEYLPQIYAVSKALMMTKDTDKAAATAWSEITDCLYKVCAEITRRLTQEQKLSTPWQQDDAADLIWSMIAIQNWEQLTQQRGWSHEQFVDAISTALVTSIVSD